MPSFVANVDPHDRSVVDEVLSAVLAAQSRVRCLCNRAADIYGRSFVVPIWPLSNSTKSFESMFEAWPMLFREVAENLMNRLAFVYVVGQVVVTQFGKLCGTFVPSVSMW